MPVIAAPPPGVASASKADDAAVPANGSVAGIPNGAEAAQGSFGASLPDDRSAGISIVADEANNSLVITATAAEYRRIRKMLESVDVLPNQVLIEATIAEVSLNDELKFGVRWFLSKGGNNFTFTDTLQTAINTPLSGGFSYFFKGVNVLAAINALNSITNVDVVSNPTLTVVENKKAILQVGDEVPILTQQATAVVTSIPSVVNSVTYRNTGIILGITPRVSENCRVVLDIEQEVSSAIRTEASTIDSPTIQQRRVKTTVNVNDGETILLAGLLKDDSTRARDQVPILGNMTLLGNAFKTKDDAVKRTELLIAITPQVIRDSHQIAGIAAEFRDKLNFSTRPQRSAPPDNSETLNRLVR